VLRAEIGDADRTGAPVRQHLLGRLVRGDRPVEVAWHGVVQQEEVDVVEAESPQATLEAAQRGLVAVVADPQIVDTNISPRSIPERRMPSPTSRSFMYAAAVSIRR
jgi:hypothetical protein